MSTIERFNVLDAGLLNEYTGVYMDRRRWVGECREQLCRLSAVKTWTNAIDFDSLSDILINHTIEAWRDVDEDVIGFIRDSGEYSVRFYQHDFEVSQIQSLDRIYRSVMLRCANYGVCRLAVPSGDPASDDYNDAQDSIAQSMGVA